MKKKKKSDKGNLIKGMTKKLPREILGDPTFTKKLKELMKGYGGVYALYNKGNLYYVGLTKDLFGRIYWHQKDRHANKWDKFMIFRIKKISYLKDIETIMHHIVKTKGNKVKGRVPIDNDFNKVLRSILIERGQEYKKLRRVLEK